jgi:hypothetical protein
MSDRTNHRAPSARVGAVASAPWIVVVLGVGVMVILLVLAVGAGCAASDDPPAPVVPALPLSTVPGTVPDPTTTAPTRPSGPTTVGPSTGAPSATPTRAPSLAAGRTSPSSRAPGRTVAPVPEVTGRYRVVSSFDDAFIGEVLVVNSGSISRDWVVRLVFPDGVRDLRTSWVESAPRPTVTRAGDAYVFTGAVPLAPGQSAALRFHFDRVGSTNSPTSCQVNGAPCR